MDDRHNNLDALRLLAAVAVVIGHAWPLTGRSDAPTVAGVLMSTTAVYVFFSISGFLIATSWRRTPKPIPFLRHRAARIFPALTALTIVTIFGVGPVMTTLEPSAYFQSSETWTYLFGLTLTPTYSLPGVLANNPTTAVNGSLWTLGPEFMCYLLVLGIGLASLVVPPKASRIVQPIAFTSLAFITGTLAWLGPDKSIKATAAAMTYFAVGALISHLPTVRIPVLLALPVALVWLASGFISRDVGMSVGWIALPIIALSIGLRSTPVIRRAGRFGDFSYGIYVWGFLVQQLVWARFGRLSLSADIAVVLTSTLVLAFISWRLVEEPALRWARGEPRQAGKVFRQAVHRLGSPLHDTASS